MRKSAGHGRVTDAVMRGYTGSRGRGDAVYGYGLKVRILLIAVMLGLAFAGRAEAVSESVMREIAAKYEGQVLTLKMNMREPPKGASHVPMFDKNGWHFWDPSGRIVLSAGERVQVTGIFNYSNRGFFLELAREDVAAIPDPIYRRPRIRVRCMVEAEGDDAMQTAQAIDLIGKILQDPRVP